MPAAAAAGGPSIDHAGPAGANLVQNGGFEEDWHHAEFAKDRRFLLLHASDIGMGEEDGRVDHWTFQNADSSGAWDTGVAHGGSRSIRLGGAAQALHRVRFAGEQNWKQGGAFYAGFVPMERRLVMQIPKRAIRVGAWCRTQGVPAGKEPFLHITAQCLVRDNPDQVAPVVLGAVDRRVVFGSGTHDWEYREVRIEPADLPSAPQWLVMSVNTQDGTAWFDDVTCVEEPAPASANRLPNAGFEAEGAGGRPQGWTAAEPWSWWRTEYYAFTGWSHRTLSNRGGAELDPVVAAAGNRSLRMTVYPGDSLAVGSPEISLDQAAAHPLEASATVCADSLRGLEIMARDETGQWLPQGDFLGDDMEDNPAVYDMGTTGAGTYGWRRIRKFFAPRKPVRSVRLYLCARGFDGVKVEKNRVGVVWWDEVRLVEHGAPKPSAAPQPGAAPALLPVPARDVSPGDRLWGKNRLRLRFILPDAATVERFTGMKAELQVTPPGGAARSLPAEVRVTREPASGKPGEGMVAGEYRVEALCKSWKEQYGLTAVLTPPGGAPVRLSLPFGTPSQVAEAGTTHFYAYPDERITVYGRLNVARDSLPELSRCVVAGRMGGAEREFLAARDFSGLLRPGAGGKYLDTARLVRAEIAAAGAVVHPWSDPVRDGEARVRVYRKDAGGERLLAETPAVRFGFMQPVPRQSFPDIRRTAVDGRGYLQVNGAPYFPVYWTPHFGIAPEASYPARLFGCKSVDLTEIVYSKNRAPDAEVKAKLLQKVAEVKRDPKLFQYELGEGEMQLQGFAWRERANWLRTAAAWIREADPDHLVSGPESWLVGHPDHNAAMAAFIPHFDVIGVEASFEDVPKLQQYAVPLMKGRRTAVLVGLETYFSQDPDVLRWRGYRSVLEGAAGVGLCPSGMLQARPDRENFLRGLNGEFRGLAEVITGEEPRDRTRSGSPLVQLLERTRGGKRYLLAVRNRDTSGPVKVRFEVPGAYRVARVRFEGRQVPVAGSAFEDEFRAPMTVHVYELE